MSQNGETLVIGKFFFAEYEPHSLDWKIYRTSLVVRPKPRGRSYVFSVETRKNAEDLIAILDAELNKRP